MKSDVLMQIWRDVRNIPGWLSGLAANGLEPADQDYLAKLDDDHMGAMKDISKAQRPKYEMPEVDAQWARERRTQYLMEKVAMMKDDLISSRYKVAQAVQIEDDFAEVIEQEGVNKILESLRRATAELEYLHAPKDADSRQVSKEMIDRARAYPLENLVETSKGMMLCPLHEDKTPSFLVKNGYGYCFSCRGSLDSIGYLMKVKGLSFPESVRKLQ